MSVRFVGGVGVTIMVIGIVTVLVIATIRSVQGTALQSIYRDCG